MMIPEVIDFIDHNDHIHLKESQPVEFYIIKAVVIGFALMAFFKRIGKNWVLFAINSFSLAIVVYMVLYIATKPAIQ